MSAATKRLCTFFSGIPAGGWFVLVVLLGFGLWLHDHDAHLRQAAALSQVRSQTAEDVAGLKKQVDAAVRQANVQNAHAVGQLEAQRDALDRKNQDLAAQLDSLRHDEQLQAAQVATLPTSQVVTRVAAQLGLGAADYAPANAALLRQGTASAVSQEPGNLDGASAPEGLALPKAGRGGSRIAPANAALLRQGMASAVPPVPVKIDGASAPEATGRGGSRTALTESATVGAASTRPAGAGRGDSRIALAESAPAAATANPVISLTDSGARKVETALVELNSCQAQSAIENQQVSNCTQRAADDEKVIEQQANSITQLNQALQAKDKILQQEQTEYKAELRVARGTFFGRLVHTSEHVALGVAIGLVIGVAAR